MNFKHTIVYHIISSICLSLITKTKPNEKYNFDKLQKQCELNNGRECTVLRDLFEFGNKYCKARLH